MKDALIKIVSEKRLVSLPNCEDVIAIATEILERISPILKGDALNELALRLV